MRIAGIVLIVAGILGLVYGGISYTRSRETVRVGPISASVKQRETVPVSPVISTVVLVAGIGLLVAGSRRRA